MNDEQLEQIGRLTSEMLKHADEVWALAMRTMPLASKDYRRICTTGRNIQETYYALRDMAYSRGWGEERIKQVFTVDTYYGFN